MKQLFERRATALLRQALNSMPVVALVGPRQVGKTTLAMQLSKQTTKKTTYLDLESDQDFNKLSDPELFLQRFENELLIIDEVQRMPDLFRVLRGLVDKRRRQGETTAHFLLLGSSSRELLQHSSESLAGRIRYIELTPFTADELLLNNAFNEHSDTLWFRGGFPDSYLSTTDDESRLWRDDFIATYMERDLPLMGVGISPAQLKRFWKMLAHYNGNVVNHSEIGRSLGLSHTSIRNYLDTLTDFYMVRQLPPWSGNLKKRLVKSPKVYIRDTGILHSLLKISTRDALLGHPLAGGSWEGFIVETLLSVIDNRWDACYFRTATQVELDLILTAPNGDVWAIEIKRASAPKASRGFHEACNDVQANRKWVIYPGADRYPLTHGAEAIGLAEVLHELLHQ